MGGLLFQDQSALRSAAKFSASHFGKLIRDLRRNPQLVVQCCGAGRNFVGMTSFGATNSDRQNAFARVSLVAILPHLERI
jgi:hypothetical protein